jgi:acyl-CoA thioester hydrolase
VNTDNPNRFVSFLLLNHPAMGFVDGVINKSASMFMFVGTGHDSPALNFGILASTRNPLGIHQHRFSDLESCHTEMLFEPLYYVSCMDKNNLSEIKVRTRWGEMDQNGHMRNVAYLDLSANCRMEFFDANGYTLMDFFGAGFGPIVLKDEIEYRAEVRLAEEITITNELAGMNEEGSRFIFRNRFVRADGKLAASVSSLVMFLDLATRKKMAPPEKLLSAILSMNKSDDYAVIK